MLPNKKRNIARNLRQNDEGLSRDERAEQHLVRYVMIIMADEIARASDGSMKRTFSVSLVPELVELFRESTMQVCMRPASEIDGYNSAPEKEMLQASVKPGYMLVRYFWRAKRQHRKKD